MTASEIEQYFVYHNENIKLLKIGFDNIRNQIKQFYKGKNKNGDYLFRLDVNNKERIIANDNVIALSRILSGIQVSWAEESIKRLLYEKNLFTDFQRTYLLEQSALDQRWYATLRIVFSIAYDLVPHSDETCDTVRIERERRNLGDELVDHYLDLRGLIKDQLVPNFSIRNKVQHGEWLFAFKPKYSAEFSRAITDKVNYENVVTTTSRFTLVNAIYQMIVDLGRFKSNCFAIDSMLTPFEYFYNSYIKKIQFEVTKINSPNLDYFINDMIERDIRGEQHRR